MRFDYVLLILRFFSWQNDRKKTNADIIIVNLTIEFCWSVNVYPQVEKSYVKITVGNTHEKITLLLVPDAYRYKGVNLLPPHSGFSIAFEINPPAKEHHQKSRPLDHRHAFDSSIAALDASKGSRFQSYFHL